MTSGRGALWCFTSSLWTSIALFPLRRQPCSSISDGGTAHSSSPNIGRSSIWRCWPTTSRRRNMDSMSNTTLSPILTPRLRCSIVFTGELSFAWNPVGSEFWNAVAIVPPNAMEPLVHYGCCRGHHSRYRGNGKISELIIIIIVYFLYSAPSK